MISRYKLSASKENDMFPQDKKENYRLFPKKTYSCSFLIRFIKLRDCSALQSSLNTLVYLFFLPYFWIINRKRLTRPSFTSDSSCEKYCDFKPTCEPIDIQLSIQSQTQKPKRFVSFSDKKLTSRPARFMLYNNNTVNKDNIKSPTSSLITLDMTQLSNFPCQSIPRPLFPKTLIPKTLILDLDETLIHSLVKGGRITSGHMVEVMLGKHAILYYVHKRPYCDSFLRKVSKWYNVVIFTASVQEYADPVIDWLEQDRKLFKARFYRQHCTFRNGAYIKDLSIVQPDLSKVIIIDNSPVSYSMHENNAIPIQAWISDPSDKNLLHLIPFLHGLRYVLDVRTLLGLRAGMFSLNS
ncbi:unnamed protein product [Pneumocystis jirovecii]|uniref:FCP1 homology domain-containing protein n=1 Tax=Pneumocystis jirovecii TaxID=42068 RepID=L0P805_PNEJI|nr:unnamed protein product [Pneumocystis jirovecii]